MTMRNRLATVDNRFQGKYKKVLCVCSAGILRSPTAALVLSGEPFNYNTRAAGIVSEYALIKVDQVLLTWADEIVCMEAGHSMMIRGMLAQHELDKKVITLNIKDDYSYRDEELMEDIIIAYEKRGE